VPDIVPFSFGRQPPLRSPPPYMSAARPQGDCNQQRGRLRFITPHRRTRTAKAAAALRHGHLATRTDHWPGFCRCPISMRREITVVYDGVVRPVPPERAGPATPSIETPLLRSICPAPSNDFWLGNLAESYLNEPQPEGFCGNRPRGLAACSSGPGGHPGGCRSPRGALELCGTAPGPLASSLRSMMFSVVPDSRHHEGGRPFSAACRQLRRRCRKPRRRYRLAGLSNAPSGAWNAVRRSVQTGVPD